MLRIRKALVAALTLGLACAASAATITVDTDKVTYLIGETIVVTTTLTTSGSEAAAPFAHLELFWSDPQIAGTPGPALSPTALTSFSGLARWSVGAGTCHSASCLVLDQIAPGPTQPAGSIPDAAVVISTLTMVVGAIGPINFSFGTVSVFGATPTLGGNATTAGVLAPEPGTAALLGLGLTGLTLVDRRRRR